MGSPFRGILVGLFFFSVGFEIDFQLIVSKFGLVSSLVVGLMALKTAIAAGACRAFGLDMPTSPETGGDGRRTHRSNANGRCPYYGRNTFYGPDRGTNRRKSREKDSIDLGQMLKMEISRWA